jgi:hypothetical protein
MRQKIEMNMKSSIFLVFLILLASAASQGRPRQYGLPAGARVLEVQAVPAQAGRAGRLLILWMLKPSKNPLPYGPEEYTCPDETRGSYYDRPTRVSLFDTEARKLINTIVVRDEHITEKDFLHLPYRIRAGGYYHVAGVAAGQEGKPTLIWLRDYNGDGRALEFALFDALACMGLETTLIGYSRAQDKVIQYPIRLTVTDVAGERSTRQSLWADYLFSKTPETPGHWKYEIDYRGRGGTLDQYEIRYNPQAERFEGTLLSTDEEFKDEQ